VLYDTRGRDYTNLPLIDRGGSAAHPTISGAWILYTKGARNRQTRVRLYNLVTGETRRLGRNGTRPRGIPNGSICVAAVA
jgi:hypothetical protein